MANLHKSSGYSKQYCLEYLQDILIAAIQPLQMYSPEYVNLNRIQDLNPQQCFLTIQFH